MREPADNPIPNTHCFHWLVSLGVCTSHSSVTGRHASDGRMTPVRMDAMLVLVDVRERVRSEVMT